ncbi:MAG: hypothetical protein JO189_14830 [Deltaproteobacteria bacterium]|nr:hypothetical protein [Deltaproteobacteria bacterium]
MAPAAYDAASETGGIDEWAVEEELTACAVENLAAISMIAININQIRLRIAKNEFLKKFCTKAERWLPGYCTKRANPFEYQQS